MVVTLESASLLPQMCVCPGTPRRHRNAPLQHVSIYNLLFFLIFIKEKTTLRSVLIVRGSRQSGGGRREVSADAVERWQPRGLRTGAASASLSLLTLESVKLVLHVFIQVTWVEARSDRFLGKSCWMNTHTHSLSFLWPLCSCLLWQTKTKSKVDLAGLWFATRYPERLRTCDQTERWPNE